MTESLMTDPEIIIRFIRAGNAKFTLESTATGTRYTYKVAAPSRRTDKGGYTKDYQNSKRFISLRTGASHEDEVDYNYIGFLDGMALVHGRDKAFVNDESKAWRGLWYFWEHLRRHQSVPEQVRFWQSGYCARCGRELTVPESLKHGIGPECEGKLL